MAACGGAKKLPEGSPEKISIQTLAKNVVEAENPAGLIHIKGSGRYTAAATGQNFNFDIRAIRDSIIWVDVSAQLLGIKVARAVIYPDSIAMINRLQKTYYTGSLDQLQNVVGTNYTFSQLQAIFFGNLAVAISDLQYQGYQPGFYELRDYPTGKDTIIVPGKSEFLNILVKPEIFKPGVQRIRKPMENSYIEISYDDFKTVEDINYPHNITLFYNSFDFLKIALDINSVNLSEIPGVPFNIPSSYVEMR